jgi:hypothetical protein
MRKVFYISGVFVILSNFTFCQSPFQKIVDVSDFTGDTTITYIDNIDLQGELPVPRDVNNEIVGIVEFKLSSEEKLLNFVVDIFSDSEIQELISSQCYLKIISTPNGKILSASFAFVNKEPDVPLNKLVKLSDMIKEEITLHAEFERDVVDEGYVKCTYWLFIQLSEFLE